MSYSIQIERKAFKAIQKLPQKDRLNIEKAIDGLAINPRSHNCIKLTDRNDEYRLRVGNYRVLYTINDRQLYIFVFRIADRKEVY